MKTSIFNAQRSCITHKTYACIPKNSFLIIATIFTTGRLSMALEMQPRILINITQYRNNTGTLCCPALDLSCQKITISGMLSAQRQQSIVPLLY